MTRTKQWKTIAQHTLHRAHVQFLEKPALRGAARCVLAFAAGFILSGAQVLGRPLPLALALVAALGFGLAGCCSYLGAAAGFLFVWGLSQTLEFVAGGFLMLAAASLFGEIQPKDRRWFIPACAGALYVLPAIVSLLGGRVHAFDVVFLLSKLLLLIATTALFCAGLSEKPYGKGAILLSLLAGICRLTLPCALPLGVIVASGAVFLFTSDRQYLLCAVLCGLVLDLTCPQGVSMCALFSLSSLVCHWAALSSRPLRAVLFLGILLAGVLFTGADCAILLVAAALGTVLSLAVKLPPLTGPVDAADAAQTQQLDQMSDVLTALTRLLDHSAAFEPEPQTAAVFDYAAEQVCKNCGKYGVCWNERAKETYLALSSASQRILQRGQAVRGDLPPFFLERCCRTSAFLGAVNEALDERQCRFQYQSRLRENRQILADQYRFLSRALQSLAAPPHTPPLHYTAEVGFRAKGVRAGSVSGDHGCSFQHGEWFYALLCDGMGTGEQAHAESTSAVRLLERLITSGFDAPDAMQVLNGIYILRQDGGFSTVDLLQLSLTTGEGYLYKWGAPCSYLLEDGEVQKIGTASPPPGLGVGEKHQAECVKLSLQRGQMLVLVSDGIEDALVTRYLTGCRVSAARELAAGILGCAKQEQSDDQTAVALRLHPCSTRKKHSTAHGKILSKPHI